MRFPHDTPASLVDDEPGTPGWIRHALHVLTVLWRVLAGLFLLIASIHFYLLMVGGHPVPGSPIGAALASAAMALVAVGVAVFLGRAHERVLRGQVAGRGTLIFAEIAAVVLLLYLVSIVLYVRSLGWMG